MDRVTLPGPWAGTAEALSVKDSGKRRAGYSGMVYYTPIVRMVSKTFPEPAGLYVYSFSVRLGVLYRGGEKQRLTWETTAIVRRANGRGLDGNLAIFQVDDRIIPDRSFFSGHKVSAWQRIKPMWVKSAASKVGFPQQAISWFGDIAATTVDLKLAPDQALQGAWQDDPLLGIQGFSDQAIGGFLSSIFELLQRKTTNGKKTPA